MLNATESVESRPKPTDGTIRPMEAPSRRISFHCPPKLMLWLPETHVTLSVKSNVGVLRSLYEFREYGVVAPAASMPSDRPREKSKSAAEIPSLKVERPVDMAYLASFTTLFVSEERNATAYESRAEPCVYQGNPGKRSSCELRKSFEGTNSCWFVTNSRLCFFVMLKSRRRARNFRVESPEGVKL